LALGGGIILALYEVWGEANLLAALQTHLVGSAEAVWLTASMLVFFVAGEFYHRASRSEARGHLVYWGDFGSGVAAILLTVALVQLGSSGAALLAGAMLTVGKLGSAVVPLTRTSDGARIDRWMRLVVVASRAPSLLSLIVPLTAAVLGTPGHEIAPLTVIMIVCFLLWLWADLLLLSRD
jgi:hypothetical protein